MNYYESWFDLKNSSKDLVLSKRMHEFLGHLKEKKLIEDYALTRRKLGFGPGELGEFHLRIAVKDLSQLENAFQLAATRGPDIEPLHAGLYSMVENVKFALYRDFPDPVRHDLKE